MSQEERSGDKARRLQGHKEKGQERVKKKKKDTNRERIIARFRHRETLLQTTDFIGRKV